MFSDSEFWRATWNTVLFCILTVPIGVLLALVIAILLNAKVKGKVAFRAIFFLPMVVAPAAVAMVWKWMFNAEYGIINTVFHLDVDWITNPNIVIITVAIVAIWSALGYDAVLLLSGIQEGTVLNLSVLPRIFYFRQQRICVGNRYLDGADHRADYRPAVYGQKKWVNYEV